MFSLQKDQLDARETNYLTLTNQLQSGYVSARLPEFCAYYSNRISYEEVALLVERMSGERLLSDQKIGQIVSDTALKISQEIHKSTQVALAEANPDVLKVNSQIDIYNSPEKEILLFEDGIQVKGQKNQREPQARIAKEDTVQAALKSKTPAVTTDIVMWQKATGKFEYIAAPINEAGEDLLSLTSVVKAQLMQEYGRETTPLNLVAITDGARTIRDSAVCYFWNNSSGDIRLGSPV